MNIEEAKTYVDAVVESLLQMGILSEEKYGRMTETQREQLAEKIVEKSEE
jgi:hypothetical protein